MAVTVDASVVVKLFVTEPDSDHAVRLFASRTRIFLPAHALAEVAEVLVRKVRKGEITEQQFDDALRQVPTVAARIELDDLVAAAAGLARRLGQSVYDCMYLAAARQTSTQLITADRRFVESAQAAGIREVVLLSNYSGTSE